ncbi:response regulator transcription factor [Pelotalea chapellei]|uniref:Response regulator n=1 Tax=Pelotalea chapellei TaxID=44671 RepID=A0ABS5UCK4_9BACT|nr:response regulator [Pelotalea chapellei]MBT1073402.1 response regulator [Pelotalea chapellei]
MVAEKTPSSFSLLLVEDDNIVCMVVGRMVARKFPEAKVYTADNGQVGLDLFREHVPRIVVTDINLPFMDGIEMASQIKMINAETKFIVLTGYSDQSHLEKFKEIGFEEYMIKPVDFDKLFAAIEKCVPTAG